jgi:soluble lytic murein transglycosylase
VRWLKAGPDLSEIDLFIESIPYDETRGYTKRVLSTYLTYQWLYTELPAGTPLDARLPAILFPLPPPPHLH